MVSKDFIRLSERLKLIEDKEIEVGDIILLALSKINGIYIVDELTEDKVYPITVKLINSNDRRYDIKISQYLMARYRFLKSGFKIKKE